jgi:hypothetical protein
MHLKNVLMVAEYAESHSGCDELAAALMKKHVLEPASNRGGYAQSAKR